ncbi:MAG: hypothetical protein SFX73_27635 [Kofleriaceae bacterium]|nr:hypothetical protein [Kofleriaceae bacterium]
MAPPATKLDPNVAVEKYAAITQAGAAADDATIKRIETSIKNSPMGWLQSKFAEVNSRAASEKSQVDGKLAEHQETVASNKKNAPANERVVPTLGRPTRPSVSSPSVTESKSVPTSGGKTTTTTSSNTKKIPPHTVARTTAVQTEVASVSEVAAQFAGVASDAELDEKLNAYEPKGQQATQMLGRIAQMRNVAEGFNGQLDVYVSHGSAVENSIAAVSNFLGVGKDAGAVWRNNPYRKMGGFLSGLMAGLSGLKSVLSLVGSICGKIGLILTVVGLLGMIFPPIGVAVSGVARVLNVIGLICDGLSFVLSGILTGLNGVKLAQQISAGASAEEKAATADLLISEANGAAGGLINMAMVFGPKFMKGLTGASRGVISSLFRRFRTVVGNIRLGLTGTIKNYANRIIRYFGFGGAKMTRIKGKWEVKPNFISKTSQAIEKSWVGKTAKSVYTSAPKAIDKMQDWTMKKWGNKAWAKSLDRMGTRAGAWAEKWDLEKQIGNAGEWTGKKVGGWGANTKLGKDWAKAADTAERNSRELAMKFAQSDAMHLEKTRWQNYLAEKNGKRQTDGGLAISDSVQDKFVASQVDKVKKQHAHDFGRSERTRLATEGKKLRDEAADKQMFSDFNKNKSDREDFYDDLHSSREQRWKLETKFASKDKERERLKALPKLTKDEELQLKALNKDLAILDRTRERNLLQEAKADKLAGFKGVEVHNWHDVYENVEGALGPAAEMLHLRDEESAWRVAEKANIRKQIKWNKGSAASGAASRGGAGIYGDIRTDAWKTEMADFAAFVAKGRPSPTVAQTVRTMLGSINRPAGSTTTSSSSGGTSTSPTNETQPTTTNSTNSTNSTTSTTSTNDTQQNTGLPDPVPDADEGGADALPYWPALIPEFDKAQQDFAYMRRVATEFKKAQIVGKQKAVDTLAVYGRYEEYAKARAEHAKKNQADALKTGQATQENSQNATVTESNANTGETKQNEARSAANNRAATDLPEPESRGFWGRILGAVKRWAKAKAAQLFGWIQEQVASVVLKGLCGVSMSDMRQYANALRNQQMRAHGVADTAASTSGQAEDKAIKLGADATKEAQSAADAIGECDKNIGEADGFISDVTAFESQLTQEKAHAQVFIAQVHAAVHAERERKKQEDMQSLIADVTQDPLMSTANDGEQEEPEMSTDQEQVSGDGDNDSDGVPDAAEAEAMRGQIHAAAAFVSDTVGQMKYQVEGRAQDYANQLKLAMTNHTGKDAEGNDLVAPARTASRTILDGFDEFVAATRSSMSNVRSMMVDPSSATQVADLVISAAYSVDETYDGAMDALDQLFERTYVGIRDGKRTWTSEILDGENVIGKANHGVMEVNDRAFEMASPTLNSTWSAVSTPISQTSLVDTNDPEQVQKMIDSQGGTGSGHALTKPGTTNSTAGT